MTHTPHERQGLIRHHAFLLGWVAAVFALAPTLLAWVIAPPGSIYLGHVFATDDHMVYAAWMRQAMDGAFFFDNRFTTDAQPGLTVHLYFWALGQVAHMAGLAGATTLARVGFSVLFVVLCGRLLVRSSLDVFTSKVALTLIVVGGGVGFLVWQTFGQALPEGSAAPAFLMGRLPTDVWQPEGFVFPSMLTNGLFMVSLCLMLAVFLCVLDAETSWRRVPLGAVGFGTLMNIHSYDVLLMALVLIGFAAATAASGRFTWVWCGRALLIGLGALPPALWFLHVLREDPVFQARAATETFSPNFRQVFLGYLPLLALAVVGLALGIESRRRALIAATVAGLGLVGLAIGAGGHGAGYWLGWVAWGVAFVAACGMTVLSRRDCTVWNLASAWAWIGLVAPYIPALYQRKLLMGLAIPLAILASVGLAQGMRLRGKGRDRGPRNLIAILALVLAAGSSTRWLFRETELIRLNVSNTTVQPAFLSPDVRRILEELNRIEGRKVVLAMPGQPQVLQGAPNAFQTPYLPDLNPILSGLTGAYTYAGHWSETPNYVERRGELTRFFLIGAGEAERRALIERSAARFIVAPHPAAFRELPLADLRGLGDVRYSGTQYDLIEVRR